ncbi:hypothetical protein EF903_26080 [Streptomyces sp. WAC05292]|nr:hypothetical protein EF903_26080 [Streptomyces sp. WAC05292]
MRGVEQLTPADLGETQTYVVDTTGTLLLAPRRSEHVACAGGKPVLGAGEIRFTRSENTWRVGEISNLSTGYGPDLISWHSVARSLDQAGIQRPDEFTHAVIFRRCVSCQGLNIVRDEWFVCAVCDSDLPANWNLEVR